VFKNQPLPFHQNAMPAAKAAMAAHLQGKFWEMHDKLFANQQALDAASLEKYAQEIGLNMNQFKAALDSNKFEAQLNADMAESSRVGVNGTPSFFINGRSVVGAQPIEAFKRIIDEELKKKGAVAADAK
jgi:protein-disulfide isomerase